MSALPPRISDRLTRTSAGCWEYPTTRGDGYARIRWGGKKLYVHRIVYGLMVGPIDDGLELDHLCRNRCCVNPEHLEPVTHAENTRRAGAQKTHCPRGHPYDEENTYLYQGRRFCRSCTTIRTRAFRAARK